MSTSDRMISTNVTRERRASLREEIKRQRSQRADDDPFFKITAWILAEWEDAEKDAAHEYLPTSEASRLTGWSSQTLRSRARQALDGAPLPKGWEELKVRALGSDYSFCVSTIPVKNTAAA